MNISKLKLLNFRNYDKINIKLSENMNIFIGDNAQGKTNLLESVVILALTKSHRLGVNPNVIKFNKNKAKLEGIIRKDKFISKLEIEYEKDLKKMFVNNSNIKKITDYISNLNVIVFTPDDLEIIKGSPNIRRNLLNIQISQISKLYITTYNEYNKILKTRNEYLKILFNNSIADKNYLDIITDKLIEKAVIIYKMRKEYIDLINISIEKKYQEITNDSGLYIKYENNIKLDNYEDSNITSILKEIYKKNYKRELNTGTTLYGPHRDDFIFSLNDIDMKFFGSQGQQKSAIIAFKLSEIPIFIEKCGYKPVLLLDDIFSELDIKKRNRLLKIICNGIQSIITTTDLKSISKKYLEDAYIFEVSNGNINRK